jgi:hypothetical protein
LRFALQTTQKAFEVARKAMSILSDPIFPDQEAVSSLLFVFLLIFMLLAQQISEQTALLREFIRSREQHCTNRDFKGYCISCVAHRHKFCMFGS